MVVPTVKQLSTEYDYSVYILTFKEDIALNECHQIKERKIVTKE